MSLKLLTAPGLVQHPPLWLAMLIFQGGWWLIILGSHSQWFWLGALLMILLLSTDYRAGYLTATRFVSQISLITLGILFDSLLTQLAIIRFDLSEVSLLAETPNSSGQHLLSLPIPDWLVILWCWFAITFERCFTWLESKLALALMLGAITGPLTYWGASYLTPITISHPLVFFLVSSLFWGLIFGISSVSQWLFKNPE
ncbi:DUF2878 family protein [Aliikangiella maris]|uniref:DUF2878 family protein n=2 Tax=Aliikangiella maris TaxID=3162458 RepID=A0ABV2BSF7_9GAMM